MSDMPSKNQGAWVWYELMTPDAAASKAFYEKVVPGWTIQTSHGGGDDGTSPGEKPYGFISNADGGMTGGVLTLSEDMLKGGAHPAWVGYIAVDDTDAMVKAIEAKGGKVLMPPTDIEMAGRVAMVADCCGAPFYIMKPTPPPGQPDAESDVFSAQPRDGRCGWNELMAGNQAKALDFYASLFGWQTDHTPPMDMGEMGQYVFITHNGTDVGAIMQKTADMPAPMWSHYFYVPSVTTAKASAEAAGGTVINGPMEVPGGQWIIQGIDPQGAMFALVGGK